MQVPLQRTKISMLEYGKSLVKVWETDLGDYPTRVQSSVLWSHYMHETGGKACWNWNIGNVKITQLQIEKGFDWIELPAWEMVNGKRVSLKPGHPGRRFRAFATLEDGMEFYFDFLRNKRYRAAWKYVEKGDIYEFAKTLKKAGYYTDSVDNYCNGMLRHQRAWLTSSCYDEAITLAELKPTQPKVSSSIDWEIVHPDVPMRGREDDI